MQIRERFAYKYARRVHLELLEYRLVLDGDPGFHAESCMGQFPTGDSGLAAQAVNCLAYDIYEHLRSDEGNLVFSPLSLSTSLAMAYAAADGETATQMGRALHFGSGNDIHDSFRALIREVSRNGSYDLTLANAIWPDVGFEVQDAYIALIEDTYEAMAENVDFARPGVAKATINEWVETKTNGRVEELIDTLDPLTKVVLTNAMHFDAQWKYPFHDELTRQADFITPNGQARSVDLYGRSIPTAHKNINGFDVVEMPYDHEEASMVFLIPDEEHSASDLDLETIQESNDWLTRGRWNPDSWCPWLQVPQFQSMLVTDFRPTLEELGMPVRGDFSKMTSEFVEIDRVDHQVRIALHEEGTEATGATSVAFLGVCFAKGTPVLTPDGARPIEELKSGDLVFARSEHNLEGKVASKKIEEMFHCCGEIVELRIGNQIIRTTILHRFFVEGLGWTQASDLKVGHRLATKDRTWLDVESVTVTEETDDVYNFRVADFHTYFVGCEEWGFGLWAHNCYAEAGVRADRPFHYYIRDNASSAILFMGRVNDPTQTEVKFSSSTVEGDERLPGDTNGDQIVAFDDFLVLAVNFGKQRDAVFAEGDFNDDGAVNFADFLILADNFGKTLTDSAVGR